MQSAFNTGAPGKSEDTNVPKGPGLVEDDGTGH